MLHRATLWVRSRRHDESDSLAVLDAGVDDDRALNSSHFDDVTYHPRNDED